MIDPAIRLRRALHLKDVPLVRRIIGANPKLRENPDFEDKSNTSLHIAAKHGLLDMVVCGALQSTLQTHPVEGSLGLIKSWSRSSS